eukprot:1157614-Pelagomonas_calceolata.AAC.3
MVTPEVIGCLFQYWGYYESANAMEHSSHDKECMAVCALEQERASCKHLAQSFCMDTGSACSQHFTSYSGKVYV